LAPYLLVPPDFEMPNRPYEVDALLERLRGRMLLQLAKRFGFIQPFIAAIISTTALAIVLLDGAVWRITIVVVATIGGVAGHVFGRRMLADAASDPLRPAFAANSAAICSVITVQSLVVLATGGLMSPLLVIMLLPTFATAMFQTQALARAVLLLELGTLGLCAVVQAFVIDLVPTPLGGGEAYSWFQLATNGGVMAMTQMIVHMAGRRTRDGYDRQLRQLAHARDHALTVFSDRTKELTTLSGELAHELKNPLASVKGLAALVGKDLDGKRAERMGVMRREIDRMQSILEEFLNFSRPLAPLNLRTVPVRDLADKVAELHEGLATLRHVEIVVASFGSTSVTCDPRKVQQILVNLIQNAIDASPDHGRIDIRIYDEGPQVIVEVLDEGEGIDKHLGDRIFEAGITTKEHGTGLGLTVARAIAQQHQGDLHLLDREGGGCRARLVLPREGAVRSTEPAASSEPEVDELASAS
jgi:two-component system sensor histidine kinase HydH